MIKTLEELATALQTLYPTSYSHFPSAQEGPFIVYFDQGEENFHADDVVLTEIMNVEIDLYSKTKNLVAERALKNLFRANKLQYSVDDTILFPNEDLYQKAFTIQLVNRYPE